MKDVEYLAFPRSEYIERVAKVRDQMKQQGIDGLLVATPENLNYLVGWDVYPTWMDSLLLVTQDSVRIAVFETEVIEGITRKTVTDETLIYTLDTHPVDVIAQAIVKSGGTWAVEDDILPAASYRKLTERLGGAIKFLPSPHIVEHARLVKSEAEIEYIRRAAEATSQGMIAAIDAARREGATDRDVATAIYAAMLEGGGTTASYGFTCVKAGPSAPSPHVTYIGRPIEGPLWLEFAASVRHYMAPICRLAWKGKPSEQSRRAWQASREAVDVIIERARPGIPASEVDAAARAALGRHGFPLNNESAYSVGLGTGGFWCETSLFHVSPANHEPLQPGMVFHLVPCIFAEDATCLDSETILITKDGVETLTKVPSELFEL